MIPGRVRRGLHSVHAATTMGLVASGLLILSPDLRARVVGGYGREIGEAHLWVGLAFAFAPCVALLMAPRGLLADLGRRLGPPDPPWAWRKVHIGVTLIASGLLTASGLVLWLGIDFSSAVWDFAADIHAAAHWVVTVNLPIHVFLARRKIVERVRILLGGEPPPLFEFDDPYDPQDT